MRSGVFCRHKAGDEGGIVDRKTERNERMREKRDVNNRDEMRRDLVTSRSLVNFVTSQWSPSFSPPYPYKNKDSKFFKFVLDNPFECRSFLRSRHIALEQFICLLKKDGNFGMANWGWP